MPNLSDAKFKCTTNSCYESAADDPRTESVELIDRLRPITQILGRAAAREHSDPVNAAASPPPLGRINEPASDEAMDAVSSAIAPQLTAANEIDD